MFKFSVRPIRFAIVGMVNTALDIGLFATLVAGAAISPAIANVVSYSAGLASSYVLNRYWTFSDRRASGLWPELGRFVAANLIAMGFSTLSVAAMAPAVGPLPAKIGSVVVTFAFNYTLIRMVVFRTALNEHAR